MENIPWAYITFEQLKGRCQDSSVLRRWVNSAFPNKPLLHQHEPGSGRPVYLYPLVQYKVISGVPMIYGIGDGVEEVREIFETVNENCVMLGKNNINSATLREGRTTIASCDLKKYSFIAPWLSFSSENYRVYKKVSHWAEKKTLLNRILVGNILSLAKGLGIFIEFNIEVKTKVDFAPVQRPMHNLAEHGFLGSFLVNLELPPLAGLGRHVSLGYGTIIKDGDEGWI